jgi:sensor c-di-GMP phosphodiesterase-like protein
VGSFVCAGREGDVRRFKDYKLLAAMLGILVTAGAAFWVAAWLQKQGGAAGSATANWTIGNIDGQIGRTVAVLDDLAQRGLDGCSEVGRDALRQAVVRAGPVKELSLVNSHGETLCTDRGGAIAPREVVSTAPTANPAILLDVVQFGPGDDRMLRVRRLLSRPQVSLAAMLPVDVLLPQVMADGTPFNGYARIALADDTLVGAAGLSVDAESREKLTASRARSDRYGLVVTAAATRGDAFATYDDVHRTGMIVTGLLALVILVAVLIRPWREPPGPFFEIERAIGAGELVPYYQPIVDIKSGAIVGAEVLVRWRKDDGTLVQPTTFVPLLEPTDLIVNMTRSIMQQASEEVGPLLAHRGQLYVSFNVAPRHLTDGLIDDLASIFVGGPISMSQIVIELTERYEIEDLATTRDLITALQSLGCRVAIDDVGTGHNGLSYILKLGVDIIKIDKMFVDAIRTEMHSQAIVDTLVDLARNLRMQIIAEGVETFEQVVVLRDRGISSAQGFVFAPPLPGAAFVQLVEALDPVVPKAPRTVITGEAPPATHAAA